MLLDDAPGVIKRMWKAHQELPRSPERAFRRHDGETPYAIHPLWAASMIMHEPLLPLAVRVRGFRVLLFHDLIEDTRVLPHGLTLEEEDLVRGMTFKEGMDEERLEVWNRSREVRLLKLYDKASNLLDGGPWMEKREPGYRKVYEAFALALAYDVERNYGELNICRIIRALCTTQPAA